jgi:rhodanese-related sulfurtransferase
MKTIFITSGIILLLYLSYRTYRFVMLSDGLSEKIAQHALILDVRTAREFNTGHIQGAINIPLSHLHTANIPLDKKRVIITCCSHGLRSVKAVSLLQKQGFEKVYNGGAWTDLQELIKR